MPWVELSIPIEARLILLFVVMASSLSKEEHGVELHVVPTNSTDRRDDLALARLGKKAVLKVSLRAVFEAASTPIDRLFTEKIRFPLDPGLQLHSPDHLGGLSRVRHHGSTSVPQHYNSALTNPQALPARIPKRRARRRHLRLPPHLAGHHLRLHRFIRTGLHRTNVRRTIPLGLYACTA